MLTVNVVQYPYAVHVRRGRKRFRKIILAESEEAARLRCQSCGLTVLSEPERI